MRRPINTVNGTYKDPNLAFSAQDALNVIPMMTEKGGTRTVSQYRQAPGLKPFCRIGVNDGEEFTAAGAGRGLRVVDGKMYAVAGRNLWQITSAGVSVNYGTIPGVGRVSMAHNQRGLGNELAIDNGQSRYIFNTQSQDLQKVTDESFPGSIKAFFIDGYLGYIEPQGRYWGHSDLSNALNYISFDEYEAEGQPDRIVTGHVSNREVLIAGQDTIEAYVNSPSGSGEAPFVRATNTVIESGCSARDSFCTVGQFTAYLDQNRTVQVLNGYTPVPISTSVIDSALQACTKQQIANAYAFAVEAEGFQIYYLTVPGKFTFGYDFKNKEWHRRSSTGLDWWAVTDVVQWNGRWYALDSRRGDILELRWYDYPFDVQEELVREWVTGTISADQNPIFVNELELLFGCGGQAYTTVDFQEQPVGPSISGDAPGGTLQIPYGPYSYTVTAGDSPIARTIIQAGAQPPGLTWNRLTATWSGTPTLMGAYPLTIRSYDQNGLWAEVDDEIIIGTVVMGLYFTDSVGGNSWQISDGATWSNTWTNNALLENRQFMLATDQSFLVYDYGGQPARTANFGVSWAASGGVPNSGTGGGRNAFFSKRDGMIGMPQGWGNKATHSLDDGVTFVENEFEDVNSMACLEMEDGVNRWVAHAPTTGQISISDDRGTTVTPTTVLADASYGNGYGMTAYGAELWFGATDADLTTPKIWKTVDGTVMEVQEIDATLTGVAIKGLHAGIIRGELVLVAWTNEYELLRWDGEKFVLSDDQPDCLIRAVTSNGAFLIIIGTKDNPGDNEGLIYTSVDGNTLTERHRQTIGNTESFSSIAALVA